MARTVIDELITLLGFEVKPNSLPLIDQFTQKLENVEKVALWATAGLTAAAGATLAFVQSGAKGAAELQRFHNLTGASVERLQSFAGAIKLAGGNSEGLQQTLSNLNSTLNPLLPGEFDQSMFQFFGGNASFMRAKDSIALLDMINSRMQGVGTQARKFEWAKRLGLDDGTARLVTSSRKDYLAFRKEIETFPLVLSEKQTKSALDFEIQLQKAGMAFNFLKSEAATSVTPVLTKWMDDLTNYVKNHPEIKKDIEDIFNGIAKGAGKAGEDISIIVKSIADGIPGLKEWWNQLSAIEKAATGVRTAIDFAVASLVAGVIIKTFGVKGIAALASFGVGYAAGTGINKAGDWVVQQLTGDKTNSMGGALYDLTHGGGDTLSGLSKLPEKIEIGMNKIDQRIQELVNISLLSANPWMMGIDKGGTPGYLKNNMQMASSHGPITINVNGANNPQSTANTIMEKLGGYNYFPSAVK